MRQCEEALLMMEQYAMSKYFNSQTEVTITDGTDGTDGTNFNLAESNNNSGVQVSNETAPNTQRNVPQVTKKRGGDFDLDGRKRLKSLKSGTEKMNCLFEIKSAYDGVDSTTVTENARVWVISTLDPIIGCYKNHFDSNLELFVQKWGNFSHSTFKKKCCNGSIDGKPGSFCHAGK
jgi:hypothetical protein